MRAAVRGDNSRRRRRLHAQAGELAGLLNEFDLGVADAEDLTDSEVNEHSVEVPCGYLQRRMAPVIGAILLPIFRR